MDEATKFIFGKSKPVMTECELQVDNEPFKLEMKIPKNIFISKTERSNLVIDIDRVFIDIMESSRYNQLVDSRSRMMLDVKKVTVLGLEYFLMVRPDTVSFLQACKLYFNIHIISWIPKDAILKLMPFIDPDGTVFPSKKQIISVNHQDLKSVELL